MIFFQPRFLIEESNGYKVERKEWTRSMSTNSVSEINTNLNFQIKNSNIKRALLVECIILSCVQFFMVVLAFLFVSKEKGIANFKIAIVAVVIEWLVVITSYSIHYTKLYEFKEGLVQFEIGIQTTNLETLKAINRYSDLTNELSNIRRLVSLKNIHIHVDLIAGLPYEDFDRFMVSFDTVYKLEAHHFQLGFLKLLEGTDICRDAEMYSYVAKGYAPYEVLCNAFITFDEICYLKDIEECLERYYNSMRFTFSLKYIIKCFFDDSPSAFYKAFAFYNRENGFLERSLSSRELYTVFMGFIDSNYKEQMIGERYVVLELLKLDFFRITSYNVCYTKLLRIKSELNVPVKLVGVGEQLDDLQWFDSKEFIEALF